MDVKVPHKSAPTTTTTTTTGSRSNNNNNYTASTADLPTQSRMVQEDEAPTTSTTSSVAAATPTVSTVATSSATSTTNGRRRSDRDSAMKKKETKAAAQQPRPGASSNVPEAAEAARASPPPSLSGSDTEMLVPNGPSASSARQPRKRDKDEKHHNGSSSTTTTTTTTRVGTNSTLALTPGSDDSHDLSHRPEHGRTNASPRRQNQKHSLHGQEEKEEDNASNEDFGDDDGTVPGAVSIGGLKGKTDDSGFFMEDETTTIGNNEHDNEETNKNLDNNQDDHLVTAFLVVEEQPIIQAPSQQASPKPDPVFVEATPLEEPKTDLSLGRKNRRTTFLLGLVVIILAVVVIVSLVVPRFGNNNTTSTSIGIGQDGLTVSTRPTVDSPMDSPTTAPLTDLRPSVTTTTTPTTMAPTAMPWELMGGESIRGYDVKELLGASLSMIATTSPAHQQQQHQPITLVLAVGSLQQGGQGTGQVQVFHRSSSASSDNDVDTDDNQEEQWMPYGMSIPGRTRGDAFGTSVAVAEYYPGGGSDNINASFIVAVGAPLEDDLINNLTRSGTVRTYRYQGGIDGSEYGTWIPIGQEYLVGEMEGEQFGHSLALSVNGTALAVGSPYYNSYDGQVVIYQLADTDSSGSDVEWQPLGNPITAMEWSSGRLGTTVALSDNGRIVAMGASQGEEGGDETGQVQVWEYDDGVEDWVQRGANLNGMGRHDQLGTAVALSGDGNILAASAIGVDQYNGGESFQEDYGAVNVYRYDGIDWNILGNPIVGEAPGDQSGISLSLSKDGFTVAIGSLRNVGGNANGSGHVRVYQRVTTAPDSDTGTWLGMGPDLDGVTTGERFGSAVALLRLDDDADGVPETTVVAVGAPHSTMSFNGDQEGVVRVYRRPSLD
jgi:hypothetical protein